MAGLKIDSTESRAHFAVTTSTTGPFVINFGNLGKAELEVYVGENTLVDPADWNFTPNTTQSGNALDFGSAGGSITLVNAVANTTVTIVGRQRTVIDTDFNSHADFNFQALNASIARLTLMVRDYKEQVDRLPQYPEGDQLSTPQYFPAKASRAEHVPYWDVDGLIQVGPLKVDVETVASIASQIVILSEPSVVQAIVDISQVDVVAALLELDDVVSEILALGPIANSIITLSDAAVIADMDALAPIAGKISIAADNVDNINVVGTDLALGANSLVKLVGDDLALGTGSFILRAPAKAALAAAYADTAEDVPVPGEAVYTFDPATAVNTGTDVIALAGHTIVDGDQLIYTHGGGAAIGGLTSGQIVFARDVVAGVSLKVAATVTGAALDLTSAGAGSAHTFAAIFSARHHRNKSQQYAEEAEDDLFTITALVEQNASFQLGDYATVTAAAADPNAVAGLSIFRDLSDGAMKVLTSISPPAADPLATAYASQAEAEQGDPASMSQIKSLNVLRGYQQHAAEIKRRLSFFARDYDVDASESAATNSSGLAGAAAAMKVAVQTFAADKVQQVTGVFRFGAGTIQLNPDWGSFGDGAIVRGLGKSITTIKCATTGVTGSLIKFGTVAGDGGREYGNQILADLTLQGDGTPSGTWLTHTGATSGLVALEYEQSHFMGGARDVNIFGFGTGIFINGDFDLEFLRCWLGGFKDYGVHALDATVTRFINGRINYALEAGVYIRPFTPPNGRAANLEFLQTSFQGHSKHAIDADGFTRLKVQGGNAEDNDNSGGNHSDFKFVNTGYSGGQIEVTGVAAFATGANDASARAFVETVDVDYVSIQGNTVRDTSNGPEYVAAWRNSGVCEEAVYLGNRVEYDANEGVYSEIDNQGVIHRGIVRTANGATHPAGGAKNLLQNADMATTIGGLSDGPSNAVREHFADWELNPSGAQITSTREEFAVDQADVRDWPRYYMKLAMTTANDNAGIKQRLYGVHQYSDRYITLDVWVYLSAGAGAISVRLEQNFGTGGSPSAFVRITEAITGLATGQWHRIQKTFDLASSSGKTLGTNADDHLALEIFNPTNEQVDMYFANPQLVFGEVAGEFSLADVGEVNTLSNVGTGATIAKTKAGVDTPLRSILNTDDSLVISEQTDEIHINSPTMVSTSSNATITEVDSGANVNCDGGNRAMTLNDSAHIVGRTYKFFRNSANAQGVSGAGYLRVRTETPGSFPDIIGQGATGVQYPEAYAEVWVTATPEGWRTEVKKGTEGTY